MALSPGESVGPYEVICPIGSGGHATVYRVRHVLFGTDHALKLLTHSSLEIRQRLLREGRTQRDLAHVNLVAVTEIVTHNDQPGLIMEYVSGPDLASLIARGPMPIQQVDTLVRGILAGMAHAHKNGVIHRDLKPTNILIQDGVPRICDFGIAKLVNGDDIDSSHTRTGSALGTPAYMAPEQIRDARRVDRRADVYSLGAVIYEMLTGLPAYPGDDLLEVFTAIAQGAYVPLRKRAPGAPDRMVKAVSQSLVFDPNQRVHTAGMLLEVWNARAEESIPAPLGVVRNRTPRPTIPMISKPQPLPIRPSLSWGRVLVSAALGAVIALTLIAAALGFDTQAIAQSLDLPMASQADAAHSVPIHDGLNP